MTSTNSPSRTLILVSDAPERHLSALQSATVHSGIKLLKTRSSEAQDAIREHAPDMILIDSSAGSEAAVDLCRDLREICADRATPIVMLHSDDSSEMFAEACDAGATEFLVDPINPTLLERRLDSAMAYVEHLLSDTLLGGQPLTKELAGRSIAPPAVFPRLVSVAIDQCQLNQLNVCVLAVNPTAIGGAKTSFGDEFATSLNRAVREFEQIGPISHPKGQIVISHLNDNCFALMIPDLGRIQDAARLGYKIHECVSSEVNGKGLAINIGIATSPGDGNNGFQLLKQAEEAVAIARQNETNSLCFRSESTNRWVFERLTLERSLRSAIELDQLIVYYQPKVNAQTRETVGFEALVRWQHPELGMVSPAQFIPLAEETGLIIPIGEWVLETACKQRQAWVAEGLEPTRMAVNLSPVQFRLPELCEIVGEVLERTGMPASALELEVTESMLMHDLKATINTLQRLKASGIYLSIDDFGTGYSSLSYLKGFPIDALKIDRSFVQYITANADDAAIATSIILMGRSLNLKVIAEGVETESQMSFLKVLQCDEIQGYLISPPVAADKAAAYLNPAK
ncbi:MAG: EAL domain-containing protein (putative c-di-GMP-specific phosphodiesterase class I) [Planctomycetota bacterium]|jgi:EAL domain-containing protein (putative c-di-GMP-specific phosphodiesterase class I)/DNA-binding NarL/FixJ family response regulator